MAISMNSQKILDKNFSRLSIILTRNPEGANIIDTNIIMPNDIVNFIYKVPPEQINAEGQIASYDEFLEGFFDLINLNSQNVAVPEVIDEISNIKISIRRKIESLPIYISKRKNSYLSFNPDDEAEVRENIKILKGITFSLDALITVLEDNPLHMSYMFGNQFLRNNNQRYAAFINEIYNKLRLKRYPEEELCADDSIVAASLILLEEIKKPINIISNDAGIGRRLVVFSSLVQRLVGSCEYCSNLYKLMNSIGISVYNSLNREGIFNLSWTTKGRDFFSKKIKYDPLKKPDMFSYTLEDLTLSRINNKRLVSSHSPSNAYKLG